MSEHEPDDNDEHVGRLQNLVREIVSGEITREDFLASMRRCFDENLSQTERNVAKAMRAMGVKSTRITEDGWTDELTAQFAEILFDVLACDVEDESTAELTTRTFAVYRAFLRHARAGGKVLFVNPDGTSKTLKLRARPK